MGYQNDSATKHHQIFQNLGGKKLTRLSATEGIFGQEKQEDFQEEQRILWYFKYHTPTFPQWSNGKKRPANAGDTGSVPGLERFLMLQGS